MDFFKAQEQARKKTAWLVVWFFMAVMGVIALAYLFVVILFGDVLQDKVLIVYLFTFGWFVITLHTLYSTWRDKTNKNRIRDFAILSLVFGGLLFACLRKTSVFELASQSPNIALFWNGELFFWTCLIVGGFIAVVSLYKVRQISRHGGRLIAQQLGGRMITRATNDPAEKRLLNVIDEMSIAAGIPSPVAYVLTEEPSLNAFAAGLTTQDSVIGVTKGLLKTMNRDELQGVIAHEISHIVNGDARLNLKLTGILYGIYIIYFMGLGALMGVVLLAYIVCAAFLALLGHIGSFFVPELTYIIPDMSIKGFLGFSTLVIICSVLLSVTGSIGSFFGSFIQAATSREREYLADASAVQFTRNPTGLISALKTISSAGSGIRHPQAAIARHFFFGDSNTPKKTFALYRFATHPPLAKRIARLGGELALSPPIAKPPKRTTVQRHTITIPAPSALTDNSLPEEISPESLTQAQTLLAGLPETLLEQAHHSTGATGILGGLLFARQSAIRTQQEKLLPPDALPTAQKLYKWLTEQPEHGAQYRLVWLDLILPTLREATETEQQQLLEMTKGLIRADGRVSPTEFAIYSILRGSLLHPERQIKRSELRPAQLDRDISDILALLTYAGHENVETTRAAYKEAITCSPAQTQHQIPAKADISLKKISEALSHLALAAPPYRRKLLSACEVAIRHDGKITPVENELLRAFAQSLDCPAPLV